MILSSVVVKVTVQIAKAGWNLNVIQIVTRLISKYNVRESHTQFSQILDLGGEKILLLVVV